MKRPWSLSSFVFLLIDPWQDLDPAVRHDRDHFALGLIGNDLRDILLTMLADELVSSSLSGQEKYTTAELLAFYSVS
ncbi:hypothetical protein [uncultured Dubosiella sp.]|jgi:hypothetical protein|uniref:hypothetical protein n=1 Tax=uncultured Dubosiella sp. TaxID=1937011 RepID=UPI00262D73EB|nr:hypothetical protein [uncultured Dubosiella sp.]